jgi:hypothetical protein
MGRSCSGCDAHQLRALAKLPPVGVIGNASFDNYAIVVRSEPPTRSLAEVMREIGSPHRLFCPRDPYARLLTLSPSRIELPSVARTETDRAATVFGGQHEEGAREPARRPPANPSPPDRRTVAQPNQRHYYAVGTMCAMRRDSQSERCRRGSSERRWPFTKLPRTGRNDPQVDRAGAPPWTVRPGRAVLPNPARP